MKRVAILISGGGSNMLKLVESMRGDHPARAVLVASNDPGATGLARAAQHGIPTAAVDHRPFGKDRAAFETDLGRLLDAAAPDIVALAGFMRILTPAFVDRWRGRMLNVHPSLLPKYRGLHTHARAIAAGDAEAGCTVHEVTAELDDGPILGQARVPVRPGDTPETLAARVLIQEHGLYPDVLRRFAEGDRTRIDRAAPPLGAPPRLLTSKDLDPPLPGTWETWLLPDGSERYVDRGDGTCRIKIASGPDESAIPQRDVAVARLLAAGVPHAVSFGIDCFFAEVDPDMLEPALDALSLP